MSMSASTFNSNYVGDSRGKYIPKDANVPGVEKGANQQQKKSKHKGNCRELWRERICEFMLTSNKAVL